MWGCSAPTWLTSPRKTWACGDLTAISLPYADQARQANFIDTGEADTRTFVPDTDATAAIIFCVEILEPTVAYRERWLVRSGRTLYKPGDAALTPLADAALTGALFLEQGSEQPPDPAALAALPSPEVLYWKEGGAPPTLRLTVHGLPAPQTLTAEVDMRDAAGLAGVLAEFAGDVQITYTADGTPHGPMPLAEFAALDPATLWESIAATRKMPIRLQLAGGAVLKKLKFTYES